MASSTAGTRKLTQTSKNCKDPPLQAEEDPEVILPLLTEERGATLLAATEEMEETLLAATLLAAMDKLQASRAM